MLNMVQGRQLLAAPYPRLMARIWERLRSLARSSAERKRLRSVTQSRSISTSDLLDERRR